MKFPRLLTLAFSAALFTPSGNAKADDSSIVAPIRLTGYLYSTSVRQYLSAHVLGEAEYGPLNLEVRLDGRIVSENRGRTPERNVFGDYPVEINLKLSRSGVNVSDDFRTNVQVRRRAIVFGEYGKVKLKRPLRPKHNGRQQLRGSGILRYDF